MTEPIVLTEDEIERFSRWIVENVTAGIVPADEYHEEGLLYNLLCLVNGWDDKYDYTNAQHEVLAKYGVDVTWMKGIVDP